MKSKQNVFLTFMGLFFLAYFVALIFNALLMK